MYGCAPIAEGGERPFQAKKAAALAQERAWRPERMGQVWCCWRVRYTMGGSGGK